MRESKRYKILIDGIQYRSKQRGFILVTVLFFLFLMSLMTLSILNSSYLELRMAQNLIIASQQFRAAEAGLKLTENLLEASSASIFERHEHFNYAGFQINSDIRRRITSYCIRENQAYIYDVIVQAKRTLSNALSLKTTFTIKTKNACQQRQFMLTKTGRSSWRELSSLS